MWQLTYQLVQEVEDSVINSINPYMWNASSKIRGDPLTNPTPKNQQQPKKNGIPLRGKKCLSSRSKQTSPFDGMFTHWNPPH